MDAASGVASLIGLATLTAQTTFGIIQAIQSVKDLPADLQTYLQSLKQLKVLLRNLEEIFQEDSQSVPVANLELLDSYIKDASNQVQQLASKIEKEVATLDDRTGLQRHVRKLRLVLESSDNQKRFKKIQSIIQGLHLCHSETTRRLSINHAGNGIDRLSFDVNSLATGSRQANQRLHSIVDDVDTLRVQADEHTAGIKQVLLTLFTQYSQFKNRMDQLEENYHWSTTVQSTMSDELKSTIESSMKPLIDKLQCGQSALKASRLSSGNSNATSRPIPRTGRIIDYHDSVCRKTSLRSVPSATSSRRSSYICNNLEARLKGKSLLHFDLAGAGQEDTTQLKRSYKSDYNIQQKLPGITRFYKKRQILWKLYCFRAVYMHVEIYRVEIHKGNLSVNNIRLYAAIASTSRAMQRGFEAELGWEGGNSSNSLTTIRLTLPQVLSEEDPLVTALKQNRTSDFFRLFKGGSYGPDDWVSTTYRGVKPLLALCFEPDVQDLEIIEFLVQQGARCSPEVWHDLMHTMENSLHLDGRGPSLDLVRILAGACDFIDQLWVKDSQLYEAVLNIIQPLDNSAPDHTFANGDFFFATTSFIWARPRFLPGEVEWVKWARSDKDCFERLVRRLEPNLVQEFNFLAFLWKHHSDSSKVPDDWGSPGLQDIVYSRIGSLIEAGANPCASLVGESATPTIEIAVDWKLTGAPCPAGLHVWFGALANAGVDINDVARHSFLSCRNGTRCLECNWKHGRCSFNESAGNLEGLEYPIIENEKELADYLLKAFEACGIYADDSWFPDGDRNEYNLSATGVDFMPSTMHDPSKVTRIPQHRKGRAFEEE